MISSAYKKIKNYKHGVVYKYCPQERIQSNAESIFIFNF